MSQGHEVQLGSARTAMKLGVSEPVPFNNAKQTGVERALTRGDVDALTRRFRNQPVGEVFRAVRDFDDGSYI